MLGDVEERVLELVFEVLLVLMQAKERLVGWLVLEEPMVA